MEEYAGAARVVVCGGDAEARRTLVGALVEAGYAAVPFVQGSAALDDAICCRPDMVVIDLRTSDMSGYALCSAPRRRYGASLPIMFVSADRTDARDRLAGLRIGADEYRVKPVPCEEFVLRVRRLLELAPARGRNGCELTPREFEILALLADGLAAPEIADRLVISPKTVSKHIQRILAKLGVHSRAQAVAHAYRERLLGEERTSANGVPSA